MLNSLLSFILFFMINSANAELQSPQELVARASLGTNELHLVVLDIQQQMVSITTKDVFRSYLVILPDLQKLSIDLNLETIHPKAIKNLGEQMIAYGIRWLDLAQDTRETVQLHADWMDGATASAYIYSVNEFLFRNKDYDAENLALNLEILINVANTRFKNEIYIGQGYRGLLAEVAYQKLKTLSLLDTNQNLFWLSKLKTQETISAYIYDLLEKAYLINITDRSELSAIIDLSSEILKILQTENIPTTIRIYDALNEVVVEAVDKATLFSWPLEEEKLTTLLNVFGVSQAYNLASRISISMYSSTPAIDNQNIFISETLVEVLSREGAVQKAQEFADIFYSSAPFVIRDTQKNEGIYTIKDSEGKLNWVIHFFRNSADQFVFALNNKQSKTPVYTFFASSYDYDSDTYVFSKTSQNTNDPSNFFVRVQFKNNETLNIDIPNEQGRWTLLQAQRIEKLPSLDTAVAVDLPPRFAKTLSGTAVDKKNKKQDLQISITENNGGYLALLSIDGAQTIPFQGFFSMADGFMYLTSQKQQDGHIYHLKMMKTSDNTWSGSLLHTKKTETLSITIINELN